MVKLKNGMKIKVKRRFLFFDQTIHKTKVGYVWAQEIYGSLWEAEEAITNFITSNNKRLSTYAYRVKHCMPIGEALYERKLWNHEGDDEMIHWGSDGGKAVAVRLDSMGCAVDYLSLCDWSNKYCWELPEGDWHYFKHSVR